MKSQKAKVFVGLSGGVDSSVSAALLKAAGYDVTGVFIKVWQPDWIEPARTTGIVQSGGCTWKEDRLDAMRVCAKLEIPFVELNLEKEYKREVVDYMIREYKAGKTPNPDVMCNKHVKFGGFYDWAMAQGADYVATGHYAQIKKLSEKSFQLCVSADKNKDQSYFLWQVRKEQLPHILFPVGGLVKPEVRKLAKKFGLITADKKDSQGLCFLGKIDMKAFLKKYIKPKSGKVLNEAGEIVGTHDGAVFLTLGERHGFTIIKKTAADKPYYVVAKDVLKNTITVSDNPRQNLEGQSRTVFEIGEVNWFGAAPSDGARLSARLRYRQPLQQAKFIIRHSRPNASGGQAKFLIQFASAQEGGAPSQSIVLYKGTQCLGGGIIES